MERATLALVGGPSGIGKTFLVDHLINCWSSLRRPLSYTTRPKRHAESDNGYIFVSLAEFAALAEAGELLNVDFVYGQYYGMRRLDVLEAARAGGVVVREVHASRHDAIKCTLPATVSILLMPKSYDDFLFWATTHRTVNESRRARLIEDRAYHEALDVTLYDFVIWVDVEFNVETVAAGIAEQLLSELVPAPRTVG